MVREKERPENRSTVGKGCKIGEQVVLAINEIIFLICLGMTYKKTTGNTY